MADDVDVNLRFTATDETGRVTQDMVRRAQEGSRALEAAYGTQLRAIEAMAKRAGVSIDEMSQRVAQAATRTATPFQTYTRSVNAAVAATQQFGTTSSTVMMTFGQGQAHAFAMAGRGAQQFGTQIAQVTQQMKASSNVLADYVKGFFGVAAAVEVARRSFTTFAENSRGMERVRIETGATKDQIDGLKASFQNLSEITGQTVPELTKGFREFSDASGLAFGDAKKVFLEVAQAAHAADANMGGLGRAAAAAMTQLKVPMDEVGGMLDNWVRVVPASMQDAFAEAAPRIMSQLRSMNITGKEAATQIGMAFSGMARGLGSSRDALATIESIISRTKDFSTPLGKALIPLVEGAKDADQVLGVFFEHIKKLDLLNPNIGLAQKSVLMQQWGITDKDIESAKKWYEQQELIQKVAKDTGIEYKEVALVIAEMNKGPQKSLDGLLAVSSKIFDKLGEIIMMTGVPNELLKILQSTAGELEKIMKMVEWIDDHLDTSREKVEGRIQEHQTNQGIAPATPADREKAGQEWWRVGPLKLAPRDEAADAAKKEADARKKAIEDTTRKYKPKFATGGAFEVGGSGGTDTTPIEFMATKGERVDITPQAEVDRYEGLQQAQDKADQSQREYFARFRDKGRQMQRLAMLDQRMDDKGGLRGGPGGGAGAGGGGGDPASGTRTGTGARGGDGSGVGDGSGATDSGLKTPTNLDPNSESGPAENLEDAYKRGYLRPPGADPNTPLKAGKGGYVDEGELQDRLAEHIAGSKLAGFVPKDGARYGIKTGSPQEWAALMKNLAGGESSFRATTHGDKGSFGGAGSRGLFQLSPDDAMTYGIRKTPFTIAELEDPEFNVKAAVQIAEKRALAGGIGNAQSGMAQYWAGAGGRLNRGDYGVQAGQLRPMRVAGGAPQTMTTEDLRKRLEGGVDVAGDGGSTTLSGRPQGYNYYQKQGQQPNKGDITVIDTPYGKMSVHKDAASDYKGFYNDLKTEGAPLSKAGSYNLRQKRWGGGWSSHSYGTATDIDDEVQLSPQMRKWITANPERWAKIKEKWNVGQPLTDKSGTGGKDPAHVEWRGPRPITKEEAAQIAERKAGTKVAGPAAVSDVETRAKERFKTAQDRQQAPSAPAGPTFTQRARAARAAAPKAAPAAPASTGAFATRARAGRAAAKAAAPVPAATGGGSGGEGDASVAPSEQGLAAGGSADAGTPYMVGEQGPELFTPAASGSVTSAGNTQAMIEAMRSQLERPIEPVIKPKVQMMGPARHRWTRHASQQYQRQATRDEARTSHTDLGFE